MNPDRAQRLLIIDDHPLFRKGVRQLVATEPEFDVVGEASNGREGIALALRINPDMILLDLNMKDMNGVEVLKAIKTAGCEARVIMLTVSDEAADLIAAIQAGAEGYLLKEMEPETLLAKLKDAADGQVTISGRLTGILAHYLRDDARPRDPDHAGLTEQERRIAELIADGKSNKLIARDLAIAEGTVKVHVKHLLRKLNLRSRLTVAVWMVAQRQV
ncbi:MAG: two-component system response regulator NarL [Rhodocyclaceae bacterium]|nr:two-component system response regulator NarL [Rhodocyclaceae bacterium]